MNILLDTYWLRRTFSQIKTKVAKVYYDLRNNKKSHFNITDNYVDPPEDQKYNTLRASKLQKTYSGKSVVNNINITLNHGDCLGILGVNGAGKTTTFRMLTREEIVDQGKVEIKLENKNIDINESEVIIIELIFYTALMSGKIRKDRNK